ncbi:MarR family transcriptional regulator [uncultured Mycolicibacterium sp.]|uniref:MarR family winged helix-turn-helix transcriptional regulator n=1 Tax=uncultured Mycolicibacterium sp. TaxID=2320817 RepID=UPI002601D0E7|nr:MarR family transcriptional regulator [uncultured Mycolicibacterium sp.]
MAVDRLADEVWRTMAALVAEHRDGWKRAVVERAGLPFSRIRVLRRLARKPMTVKEIAHAVATDAPAATVAVNDLQARGLVVRRQHPDNRRCKIVSLTEAGRELVRALEEVDDPAPPIFDALDEADLRTLRGLLHKLQD